MKKLVPGICAGVSLLISLILLFIINNLSASLPSQQMANRWDASGSSAHVSCFFSADSRVSEDTIISFEHSIDSELASASIILNAENSSARLWVDAYSASGTVNISTDRGRISADAMGVGGDFFLFHPVKLLYGSYFSGSDLMQDYCIIDEDAAWQLFGSNDVAGMMVDIGGIPHVVAGVIEREAGKFNEAAGLDSTRVYLSYASFEKNGRSNGISHYEIVMPNPISNFAYDFIVKKLGYDEDNSKVVENSSRYSFMSRLDSMKAFWTRSMNTQAIVYPYWENVARCYEDILAVLTFIQLLFACFPVIYVTVILCRMWKRRTWSLKTIWHGVTGFFEQLNRRRNRRKKVKAKVAAEGYAEDE